ncbi:hypothetical protein AADZ91_10535 [Colwelliaceae bacterium 6441]
MTFLQVHFELSDEQLVADKGYHRQALPELIKARNDQYVILRKGDSKRGNDDIDCCFYLYRHLVYKFNL